MNNKIQFFFDAKTGEFVKLSDEKTSEIVKLSDAKTGEIVKLSDEKTSEIVKLSDEKTSEIVKLSDEKTSEIVKLSAIRKWAMVWTGELADDDEEYYWTPTALSLKEDVMFLYGKGMLFIIAGFQGTGKTKLAKVLSKIPELNAIYVKWIGEKKLYDTLYSEWVRKEGQSIVVDDDDGWGGGIMPVIKAKDHPEYKKMSLARLLEKYKTIIIDLRDYNKRNMGRLDKDLNQVQDLWCQCLELSGDVKPCFIITIQREMMRKAGHYLFGKSNVYILPALTPEEFISFYEKKFGSTWPFDKEALQLLAKQSQGRFRRFMKYINLCIKSVISKVSTMSTISPISAADVDSIIAPDVISEDIAADLETIFPRKESFRQIAPSVLQKLCSTPMTTKQIAEEFFKGETMVNVSRFLTALEEADYIKGVYNNREKVWSIK